MGGLELLAQQSGEELCIVSIDPYSLDFPD